MNDERYVAGEQVLVPIKNIKLHPDWPYRKELGHLDGLVRSLNGKNGQLQAICIDTSGFLICGRRRLAAAQKLGWTRILCRIVDVADPLTAMKEENENRLNLSPSEMTAIMCCIEASERKKARTRQEGGVQEKFPEGGAGQARDKAAATFGFSGKTFEAMKTVDDQGTEPLKKAWNAGEVATHDAATIASESAKIQNEAVKRVREKKAKTVKAAAKQIMSEQQEVLDDNDFPVPGNLRHIFEEVPEFRKRESEMRSLASRLQRTEQSEAYKRADQGAADHFRHSTANFTGAKWFHDSCPSVVHQECSGQGCEQCRWNGFLTVEERGEVK